MSNVIKFVVQEIGIFYAQHSVWRLFVATAYSLVVESFNRKPVCVDGEGVTEVQEWKENS
ncbi:hypothetical protein M758_2G151500 [Ceratodon purpureus]|nr:hypothetical protein M758_2G151500 [Ceratodon purpureus]